jgi:D-citramalate synthase
MDRSFTETPGRVEIMDTTLRDGEQMRDVSYGSHEKLALAKLLLEELRVDRIEIASAKVSAGEQEACRTVISWARTRGYTNRVEILGFTDTTVSVDWIVDVGGRVLNLLAKGSLRHCREQLRKTPQEHLADIQATLRYARGKGLTCNLYLEDWSAGMLNSPDYVFALLDGLADSEIERFMLPDTLGLLCPSQVEELVSLVLARYPQRRFDFHAHNDYGLATADTLAAVRAGIRGVHCTVNGMGERAGNAAIDEVAVGLRDFLGLSCGIDETKLYTLANTVEVFSGHRIPSNKPITGTNVFTQTAGIHADGDRKGNLYAGNLLPERFGRHRQYALGKLSSKSNLDYNLKALGIDLTQENGDAVLKRIVSLGDLKQIVTAREDFLPNIISDILGLHGGGPGSCSRGVTWSRASESGRLTP